MRLLLFLLVFFFIYSVAAHLLEYTDNQLNTYNISQLSPDILYPTDLPPIEEGQYLLHKDKIDSEIEILKEKYPVLNYDLISYKFMFVPKQGFKQLFESDGSPFVIIKIYTKNTRPGDMISIYDVKYKDPSDSNDVWKKFETKLIFTFE